MIFSRLLLLAALSLETLGGSTLGFSLCDSASRFGSETTGLTFALVSSGFDPFVEVTVDVSLGFRPSLAGWSLTLVASGFFVVVGGTWWPVGFSDSIDPSSCAPPRDLPLVPSFVVVLSFRTTAGRCPGCKVTVMVYGWAW